MRIVQVANFVHPASGGVRVAIDELGARYAAAGHTVMSIRPGDRHHLVRDDGGRVHVELPGVSLPSSGGYRVLLRRAPVASVIASWRPEVVEVHDTTTLLWAGGFGRTVGATTVMVVHERLGLVLGDHVGAGRAMRRAAAWHVRQAIADFDQIVAPSRYAAAELDGFAAVRVVPLGVDLELFRPERRHEVRRPAEPRRIVLVSRLSNEKRPVLAVQAVSELRWRGADVELVVVGDGPRHDEVVAAAASGGVRMLGHIGDRRHLAALLADADAVICPGPRETFGLAALEALACGTPVVSVEAGAVPELLAPGAGLACRTDPVALADGLATMLAGDRKGQRRAARAIAERYPWQATADAMLDYHATGRKTVSP